jgi:hypothetical protein
MATIYRYQKTITPGPNGTTVQHRNSEDNEITELATVNGLTYISVPDGVALSEQPVTLEPVALDDTLREQIKAASPHSRLIGQRMIDTIRAAYSIDDEMYFARIGVGAALGMYLPSASELEEMTIFGAFVEGVREWGRSERAKLGV